jgi:RNA polymerase sigma-70 factor (ECF subfamily)
METTIAQLFREHYDHLCEYAEQILGSAADAEDVVQTVFVVLNERKTTGDSHVMDIPTAKYLYGAVRNRAVDVIRHRAVEIKAARRWTGGGDSVAGTWHSETTATPEEDAIADDLSRMIRAAISQLPPRCRETFVLSRDHHLSYAEIARVMGVSVATVELQMGRAIKALQEVVRLSGGDRD